MPASRKPLPASEADVAATVRWAAATGRGFAAQGSRHSVFGRAQMGDGIVAAMRRLRAIHDLRDDRVVVDAGATWREVLAAPDGGWQFRLEVVKELSGSPPDDAELLAGLADERPLAQASTLPYSGYLDRLAALEQALRANGQWWFPHPWLTTFVGDAAVEPAVALSPILRASVTSPLVPLPADRLGYALNLIRLPPSDDPVGARGLVTANRAVYERVRDAGGTLYPVSAFPMSRADWRSHFGEAFGPLAEAKDEHDPGRVLRPGYELF